MGYLLPSMIVPSMIVPSMIVPSLVPIPFFREGVRGRNKGLFSKVLTFQYPRYYSGYLRILTRGVAFDL